MRERERERARAPVNLGSRSSTEGPTRVAENLERERALGKKRERRVTHFGFYITS